MGEPPPGDLDFGALVEAQRPRLLQQARRLAGDAQTAADLVQETMLRALQHRDRFAPGTQLGAWVATILTRAFLDLVKHQKMVQRTEPELAVVQGGDGDPAPAIAAVSDTALERAVQSLDRELREVVERCYLQRMRYREAAAALQLPIGTVATRLMRARTRLRELLGASIPSA
jgi:RNA polymerase sigma factor (sigma-70 family)